MAETFGAVSCYIVGMHRVPTFITIALVLALQLSALARDITSEQLAFFESKIRPILADACYECHSNEGGRVKGGLALDSRDAMLLGGDSGEVIVPGDAEDSLLWVAINYEDADYEMPPKQKLPDHVIADFKKWIEMGAPDPRESEKIHIKTEIDIEEGKKFWSFQKPKKVAPGAVSQASWPKGEIDRYILSSLDREAMAPNADAGPDIMVRRLFFDLIGLPPTPDQARQFHQQWAESPDAAMAYWVDQLLASEQYGERWGRYWLDVARYAESTGKETNVTYPHAWRYRDYVIDSFNEDKPYDRFLSEQIAGDLLPIKSDEDWQENLIATGFLAIGSKGLNQDNGRQFQMDVIDDQIDTVSQSVLGLTVSCARCHDHKFDPIPTTDYYALAGIFLSTETFFGTVTAAQNKRPSDLLELPLNDPFGDGISVSELTAKKDKLAETVQEIRELRLDRDSFQGNEGARLAQRVLRLRSQVKLIEADINSYNDDGSRRSFAMGVQELDSPVDAAVLFRGEVDKPAQTVPRGFVQVLHHEETPEIASSANGRRELAQWLTSEENPLTARVMANRIWLHLFGEGLVRTPDNFGTTGELPSHPELLDHLALRLIEHDWSIKSMIREVMLSRTYRMSSDYDADYFEKDPENRYLWRANQRRLDAESIRDTMLAASGQLDLERPRGSKVAEFGNARVGIRVNESSIDLPFEYRSVYLPIVRDNLPESLALFDFAEPDVVRGTRESTNVPAQALYLMNSKFLADQSKAMAWRVINGGKTNEQRTRLAFQLTYGRKPTQAELQSTITFFKTFHPLAMAEGQSHREAMFTTVSAFCQGLFSAAEFRFLY